MRIDGDRSWVGWYLSSPWRLTEGTLLRKAQAGGGATFMAMRPRPDRLSAKRRSGRGRIAIKVAPPPAWALRKRVPSVSLQGEERYHPTQDRSPSMRISHCI